ncbi:hypothetical protein ACROYT_G003770 [Oculina patagonica]
METPTNVSWKAEKEENATSAALSTSESAILASLAAVYFIVMFASIFGNSVIIHIIRTRHILKTATNKLILNQACADLIITFTAMRDMLSDDLFYRRWFGGDWGAITCNMRLLSREVPGEGVSQDQRHEEAMKTAKKVTRMMITDRIEEDSSIPDPSTPDPSTPDPTSSVESKAK